LRFEPAVSDSKGAFACARTALTDYLHTQGLDAIRIVHGRRAPLRERSSGKLCRVCNAPREHH
jgi:hypothetical protein